MSYSAIGHPMADHARDNDPGPGGFAEVAPYALDDSGAWNFHEYPEVFDNPFEPPPQEGYIVPPTRVARYVHTAGGFAVWVSYFDTNTTMGALPLPLYGAGILPATAEVTEAPEIKLSPGVVGNPSENAMADTFCHGRSFATQIQHKEWLRESKLTAATFQEWKVLTEQNKGFKHVLPMYLQGDHDCSVCLTSVLDRRFKQCITCRGVVCADCRDISGEMTAEEAKARRRLRGKCPECRTPYPTDLFMPEGLPPMPRRNPPVSYDELYENQTACNMLECDMFENGGFDPYAEGRRIHALRMQGFLPPIAARGSPPALVQEPVPQFQNESEAQTPSDGVLAYSALDMPDPKATVKEEVSCFQAVTRKVGNVVCCLPRMCIGKTTEAVKSTLGLAPEKKKMLTGLHSEGPLTYFREHPKAQLFLATPIGANVRPTGKVDKRGNPQFVTQPEYEFTAVSRNESSLIGRPAPVPCSELPPGMVGLMTDPLSEDEKPRVVGVAWRESNLVLGTAGHNIDASPAGLRMFRQYGGKSYPLRNVTIKRPPNIGCAKGTGFDLAYIEFADRKEADIAFAIVHCRNAPPLTKSSPVGKFYRVYGATEEGFIMARGQILPQSELMKRNGVLAGNASTARGCSGSPQYADAGPPERFGTHLCGVKGDRRNLGAAPAAHRALLNYGHTLTTDDFDMFECETLNDPNDSTVKKALLWDDYTDKAESYFSLDSSIEEINFNRNALSDELQLDQDLNDNHMWNKFVEEDHEEYLDRLHRDRHGDVQDNVGRRARRSAGDAFGENDGALFHKLKHREMHGPVCKTVQKVWSIPKGAPGNPIVRPRAKAPPACLLKPKGPAKSLAPPGLPPLVESDEDECPNTLLSDSDDEMTPAELPPTEPPEPEPIFRLAANGKGYEHILNESCLSQETQDRHRHHSTLVQVKKLQDAGLVTKEFVVNESAITPTPGSLDPVEADAAAKVKKLQTFLAGSALLPEGERYWHNFRGDKAPAPLPPKPTTHSAAPSNAEAANILSGICKGGVLAAKAGLSAACTTPEHLITLPVVADVIQPMIAKQGVQAVMKGQEETFRGLDGQPVFSKRGTYRGYGAKEKEGENTTFSKEWQDKLAQHNLAHLSDHIIPKSNRTNLRDSMEAHAARLKRSSPVMDSKARHAFDIASQNYQEHLPPLFEEASDDKVPRGWQKVIDNLQHKSSGWNARYRPLDKKAWAASKDQLISKEFRKLVSVRMALRAAAGPRMGTMTDDEQRRLFLQDPKEGFLKQETHGKGKSKSKRWRIIWNASLLDSVCQSLMSLGACKSDILNFQTPGTTTLHGLGTGHDPRGIEHLVDKVRAGAGTQQINATDASGFDMSVPRLGIMLDAERKSMKVSATPPLGAAGSPPRTSTLSDEDKEAIHMASALWFYCDAFANSCHSINFFGEVWGCDQYGMTASGVTCTGSQNSFFRGFVLLLAGAEWAITVGDDESHTGEVDNSVLSQWGTVTKKGSETVGSADDFSMLSHRYVYENGRVRAEYLNVDKMLGTNLLMVSRGERIPPVAVAAQLNVLRDTPGAIQQYREIAEALGGDLWSANVNEEYLDPLGLPEVLEDIEDRWLLGLP